MIPEAAYAMLACARIGAIHSIVFAGFSPDSLATRIEDAGSKVIITADEGLRGGKTVALKKNADEALSKVANGGGEVLLVVRRTGNPIAWTPGRDLWVHEEMAKASAECAPEEMNAEDPLFILYTSGSTGTPKACCTRQAAISSMRRSHISTFSTTTRAISIGARQTSAG